MENYQIVKAFIASAKEYSIQKTEITMNTLQRYLQILSATDDLSIFDIGTCEAAEFYVSMYELMSGLDAHSEMLWCCVSVLQAAARNPNARDALIHTYKFTPILAGLIGIPLISEKRYRVLKLLEELTYRVNITWQEGHLADLIKNLVKFVENTELISVALGVLVNICYKNTPAVYTLLQCVDTKILIKTILRSQGDKVDIRVQLCKLMMILDYVSGDIPDSEIVMFVQVTYTMMEQALKSNNVHLLQHIVDFFKDMKDNRHARQAISSYTGYYSNTEALIRLVSEEKYQNKGECMSLFLEFLQFLLLLDVADLRNLYPLMTKFALGWVRNRDASSKALDLVRVIAMESRTKYSNSDIYQTVVRLLEEQLQTLLLLLEPEISYDTAAPSKHCLTFTSLLSLLQELACSPALHSQIDAIVTIDTIQKLFNRLVSPDQPKATNLFEESATTLYIQALCFLSKLMVENSKKWLEFYSELLHHNQVLRVIAAGLYSGSGHVKQQVLHLIATPGFPKDSLTGVAECMVGLNQLLGFAATRNSTLHVPVVNSVRPSENLPMLTVPQERVINSFISRLEDQHAKNQINDKSTSSVIELYQFKLSAMNHAERAMQASLASATEYSTHLTQRIAQLNAELSRLHHLLYTNQQIVEGGKLELKNAKEQLQEAQNTANNSYKKYCELKQDMQSKTRCIAELTQSTETFKQRAEVAENHCAELEKQVIAFLNQTKNQDSTIESLKNELTEKTVSHVSLEEKLKKREQMLKKKEADIEKQIAKIQGLEREVANQSALIKGVERSLNDKNKELLEVQKKLSELQKMRDVIYEISAGKLKMDAK